ncbi:hypothetical protein M011DRAFT_458383 [Sporormia fimetaria CBS 119925]|uniref:Uncharacterized protein n=1 Tax=Sporormia fimetaria CBS 119925 TaxID=1340428 RepID=A0A6A6VA80_9PLEO|nr:hypothetical protein M011DRAFT_458383 [Sporormia fimetaria CBS 119925]
MKITFFATALFTSTVAARVFYLYEHNDLNGNGWQEDRPNDGTCWNIGDHGRKASSVSGVDSTGPCTTFYNQRGCTGGQWVQRGYAATVPLFLNDNFWSFKNQC